MKNIRLYILFIIFGMFSTSCETEFPNVNNPTEDVIFSSKEGLMALSIGINQYFTTTVYRQVIEAPGITTRELGVTNTFLNINELARGGSELAPESGGITTPWVTLMRAKGMTESLIANVDNLELAPGTRSGLLGFGNFYKALCLGYMINMFEQVPTNNSADGAAQFSDRATVLAEAISLLTDARDAINANAISDEFTNTVLGDEVNLLKSINAYLSRFSLMAGNYNDAITHADAVLNDGSSPESSFFTYDANNRNPIWNRTVNSADLDPQTNFGLVAPYLPEAGDGRIGFYLGADAGFANTDAGGQALSELQGFFSSSTSQIPIYLMGEMLLNKAEAFARNNDLANAVTQLNLVRQKTNDPLGVNAGLGPWAGNAASQTDILEEIYKNRGIELFLTGLRLEDSRRFHSSFTPTQATNTTNERNRNFYPYPSIERDNNPNTPADPGI